MQFAGALPEQLCLVGINPADQFVEKCTGWCGFFLEIGFLSQHPFVITAYGIQRKRPAVAFVCDSTL